MSKPRQSGGNRQVGDSAGQGEVAKPGKVVPAPCNPPASTQVHPAAPAARCSRGPAALRSSGPINPAFTRPNMAAVYFHSRAYPTEKVHHFTVSVIQQAVARLKRSKPCPKLPAFSELLPTWNPLASNRNHVAPLSQQPTRSLWGGASPLASTLVGPCPLGWSGRIGS